MPQPLVLAIEPDLRQAAIVKRIVREKVQADVAVVDSRDAAMEAMRTTIPDVLLLSALMSPRDEDELIAHLRTLEHADHLQTHTIPQLASALNPTESRGARGLLSAFRRKKEPESAPSGCDPDLFADEIRVFLERAADKKRERANARPDSAPVDTTWRNAHQAKAAAPAGATETAVETDGTASSSWSSPFEWKPASNPSSPIADPESRIADPASRIAETDSTLEAARAAASEALLAQLMPTPEIPSVEPVAAAAPAPEPLVVMPTIDESAVPQAQERRIQDSRIRDSGMRDSGLGIRDQRSAIRDRRLGGLASWARAEGRERQTAKASDDLRGLLTSLAVPAAVVGVGYGRGCRIRRVRVPAAREPQETEAVGAVILSKRVLAEQRGQRDQPTA